MLLTTAAYSTSTQEILLSQIKPSEEGYYVSLLKHVLQQTITTTNFNYSINYTINYY